MSQTIAQTYWYGNTAVTPAEFMGLSPFYNTLSTATAQNAANVIGGGGTGSSNTSIWLVCWGPETIFGVYPRGSKAGLDMEDKGDVTPGFDSVGNRFEAYTSWFRQQGPLPAGLALRGAHRQRRRHQCGSRRPERARHLRHHGAGLLLVPRSLDAADLGHHQDRRAERSARRGR
jgi:hypothetical protein